jgi:iron complex outermembrane receptor protein
MIPSSRLFRLIGSTLAIVALALQAFTVAQAQSLPAGGTVSGRIYNPATKEYVRNAEIRVDGTALLTTSEDGGYYALTGVPPGPNTVSVTYAGYPRITQSVTVGAGATAVRDFDLAAGPASNPNATDTVTLTAYVVSSEAEGNAKAVMNQRNSMNMGTSISSDVFGDVTEGNVGEFLKYLPGIEMESVEADTRGPRLGGMDPQYTGVSVDGMKSASADGFAVYGGTENGGSGDATRSFSFEQVSINSIESIEISRVTPADLDADAPAGTINLKSKRAFDTRGRRVTYSLSAGLNSEEFTFRRTPGPDDGVGRKLKPTASFNYSESFLGGRLGILLGLNTSNLYNEQQRVDHTYGTTTAGVGIVTALAFKDGPKWTERSTASMTVDLKATPRLVLSLTASLNTYEMFAHNRITTFTAGANQAAPADLLNIRTTAGSMATGGGNINKQTKGYTLIPKFEYKWRSLTVDGAYSVSVSENSYGTLRNGAAGNAQVNALSGLNVEAVRPAASSSAWSLRQIGGADWAVLANYKNPRVTDDVRAVYNEVRNATLNGKWVIPLRLPTFLKFGFKHQERILNTDRTGPLSNYAYVGPGGGTAGSYADFPSAFDFNPSALGVSFRSISGAGSPVYANREAIGHLFQTSPQLFTNTLTADNHYSSNFADKKRFVETIPSAYLLANTRLGRWQFQGGYRWEKTETTSEEFDPLTPTQVAAAGYTVSATTGRATTIPGLNYQYLTRAKTKRRGSYDNFFPSFTAKYRFSENLLADIGYGESISRPNINNISGLYSYNEEAEEIRVANPNLKPETSKRVAASVGYYFTGAGSLTATFTETHIRNLRTTVEYSAPEFGITDPTFADYTVITTTQGQGSRRFRSMELSYRQNLKALPAPFRGTTVFATYTRTYADERRRGLTPHTITGGFDYRYKRLSFGLRAVWQDDAPWFNATRYRPQIIKYDGSINLRLVRQITAFVQARNIFNRNHEIYEATGALWRAENYGGNWVFGVRGEF